MRVKPFTDIHPDGLKILFLGLAQSTHTHAWIGLLKDTNINIQLFAMPNSFPPPDWSINTYITSPNAGRKYSLRKHLYKGLKERLYEFINLYPMRNNLNKSKTPEFWLKEVIEAWNPDIIHTLGLFDDQGGLFYYQCRKKYHLENHGKWVLQLRGGSDLALRKNNPTFSNQLRDIFMDCDQIITDNLANVEYIKKIGIEKGKIASIVPVPGTGGIDLDDLKSANYNPPSQRERVILWPKAYESPWSKALPVLEALKLCWGEIAPCEIYMLAANPEVNMWFWDLPADIRDHCHIFERVDRAQVFALLKIARVMLAPSLIDGIPNTLYEAMAYGAFPIVSPLDTIKPVVQNEKNVLFARNLYSREIATALVRAMTDDELVDHCAQENLELVKKIADRKQIAVQVADFYQSLIK
jgi:glycosyltransferase involved in cell wall biosynthesis